MHVGHSQTAVFFDFDNDGYLDLFRDQHRRWTRTRTTAITRRPKNFEQLPVSPSEHNILYHNNRSTATFKAEFVT